MSQLGTLKGVTFGFVLFFSAYFGVIFMTFPFLPLLFLSPKVFRAIINAQTGFWIMNTVALMEIFFGMKIVLSGDEISANENSIIIMNHRTRLDWMFFWSCIWRQSSLASEKIILKSPLKRIPGAGWAMQCAGYIFINRNWDSDQKTLQQFVDFVKDSKTKVQVLLFPEGTDFTAVTKRKSDEFAAKNNLTFYEHVLHPRTTGFAYLAQYMRKEEMLDAVYDVTLGYPQNLPQDEKAILRGDFPAEIHLKLRRHKVQTLPISEDGLREWCSQKWKQKENVLKEFYTKEKMFGDTLAYADNHIMLHLTLFYWTVFLIVSFSLFYWFSMVRWYVAMATVIFVVLERASGGLEFLQIIAHNRWWRNRLKNR